MRLVVAYALLAASAAFAQPPTPSNTLCGDCGVVRSVRSITKEIRPLEDQEDTKPSGLVASVPLKGGKPQVGSSTKVGKEAPTLSQTWEVVVAKDDGKFQVMVLNAQPGLKAGDKVRIVEGKPVRR